MAKRKKGKPISKPGKTDSIGGIKLLDSSTAQGAFFVGFVLIFIGFIVAQLGLPYAVAYVLYIIGTICAIFSVISVGNPMRFVYLYSLLTIYMLLNQGASTDLRSFPVWFFRASSFALFVLFLAVDTKQVKAALMQVNWKHPLLWLVVALIVSGNIITNKPIATFAATLTILSYSTLAFLLFTYIRTERELRSLLEIVVSIGFVVAFWGLFVFYGGLGDKPLDRPLSTVFYWHNPAAGYLLMIFPICLAMYLSMKNIYQTFQMMWFFFIIFTAFGLTLSRGGWLSSFIPLLIIPLWLHYKGELRIAKLGGRWGQVVLAIALAAFSLISSAVLWAMIYTVLKLAAPAFVLSAGGGNVLQRWLFIGLLLVCSLAIFIPPILRGRFGDVRRKPLNIPARILLLFAVYIACALPISIARPGKFLKPIVDRWNQIRIDDFSAVGRFNFYSAGWDMFKDNWVIGTGFETYGYEYPKYQKDPSFYSKDPHNVYLRFIQEGGLIGAGVILLFLWQFFALFKKLKKREKGNRLAVFQIALAAAILGELQHMFLDFDWTFPILPMMVISYVVILRNTYSFMTDPETAPDEAPVKTRTEIKPPPGKLVFGTSLVCAIILAGTSFWIGLSYYYQQKADDIETGVWLAQYMEGTDASDQTAKGFTRETVDEMMRYNTLAVKIFPLNPDALFNLMRDNYLRAERLAGIDLSANPRGRELYEQHLDKAIRYSEQLYKVEYMDPKVNYYRGQVLLLASGGDEATKKEAFYYLEKAIELNPINIPLFYIGVADYYYRDGRDDKALEKIAELEKMLDSIQHESERESDWINELAGRRLDWADLPLVYRKAQWIKGEIYREMGDGEKAISAYFKGANTKLRNFDDERMAFENISFNLVLAEIAFGEDDFARAKDYADKVLTAYDSNDLDHDDAYRKARGIYSAAGSEIRKMREIENEQTTDSE